MFSNDMVAFDMFRRRGKAEQDLCNYVLIGCYEPAVMGREMCCSMSAWGNLVKPLEAVLNNGCTFNSVRLGPECRLPGSAAEFEAEYYRQLDAMLTRVMENTRAYERAWKEINPSPLLSGTMPDCIRSGRDVSDAGTRYNSSGVMCCGLGTVVDSLIYIVAFANEDYSITQQGDFANLRIGIKNADGSQQTKVREVSAILEGADIDHQIAEDIEVEIWRKYILNCAYNTESAYYDNAIGQLRSDPVKAKEYEALVQEAYEVALAKGVGVKQEHVDAILHRFYHELAEDATSSLQRDIRAGRRAEVDTFSGYIAQEAERLGISVPVTEKMYEGLKAHQK